MTAKKLESLEILLVEDNPGDVRLTQEALKETKKPHRLSVVRDGIEALAFLRKEGEYRGAANPALVLLDLNLPRKDGREVLGEMRRDPALRDIPVIVLTASQADRDMLESGNLNANYINKPPAADELANVMATPHVFFATAVKPRRRQKSPAKGKK